MRSAVLNARASAAFSLPLALAASSSARPTADPRAAARRAGADVGRRPAPSGPSASRIRLSRVPLRAGQDAGAFGTALRSVRRGRGQGASATPRAHPGRIPQLASSRFFGTRLRACGLGSALRLLVLEPVGAGGHDDLVALLFGQAIVGEDAALVLGPVARLALAALLGALLLDELVGGEVGEVVEACGCWPCPASPASPR